MKIAGTIISIIAGAILFGNVYSSTGRLLTGALLGFLFASYFILNRARIRQEKQLREQAELLAELKESVAGTVEFDLPIPDDLPEAHPEPVAAEPVASSPVKPTSSTPPIHSPQPTTKQSEQQRDSPSKQTNSPAPVDRFFHDYILAFFTRGNVVLRVGLVVLFFGVAFLLKYAAERSVLPIELRLVGIVLAGLGMLLFGWRLRQQKPGFALLTQGGGVGILFLTVFAAAKLYHLLPMPLSFAIMLGLVCTSAALALLQDARSLALFGAAGGFLAPVLLSTGSGSHVALFSYYALLNTGILTIAWFRAWRELNLLGFVFTLGIGTIWGARAYQPQFFSTTEPFLVLYFLMFTIIGVLFAFRQPPRLKGYVDGTLVFGTPIICFSLQAALVKDMEYGMAISALLVSIFYIGLASLLWNKGDERLRAGMRTLTEAFLALGIVFVTMAVPLALSGHWTAVTWAMEGAALIWIGVRQNRIIPRNFGFLLQFGAAFFFLNSGHFPTERPLLLNGAFLGSALISLTALFSSWYLYRADNLRRFEKFHHLILFIWGVAWWFAAGINELDHQVMYRYVDYANLLFVAVSCAVLILLSRRINWSMAAWPCLGLLPLMALVALDHIGWRGFFTGQHVFASYGFIAWPMAFLLLYYCFFHGRQNLPDLLLKISHIFAMLLVSLIISSEVGWQVHSFTFGSGCWTLIVWGLVPALLVALIHNSSLDRFWPLSDYENQYRGQGSALIYLLVWGWLLAGCWLSLGNAEPLPFIPIINPLELSQLLVMLLFGRWLLYHRDSLSVLLPAPVLPLLAGATAFIWINSVLARAMHQLLAIPFNLDAMLDSRIYQASLSILWGVLALAMMVTAGRRKSRTIWITGSVLIGITVGKLFLVDLAKSGTIERIVSFLAVGILLMIIGYFSPLPPVQDKKNNVQ